MISVLSAPQTHAKQKLIANLSLGLATVLDMFFFPAMLGNSPHTDHMVLYTWLLYNPSLISIPFIFCLGILQDCASGLYLGTSSIIFLCLYGLTVSNRHHFNQHKFLIVWLGFASIETLIQVVSGSVIFLLHGHFSPSLILHQCTPTIILYPLINRSILSIQKKIQTDQ